MAAKDAYDRAESLMDAHDLIEEALYDHIDEQFSKWWEFLPPFSVRRHRQREQIIRVGRYLCTEMQHLR